MDEYIDTSKILRIDLDGRIYPKTLNYMKQHSLLFTKSDDGIIEHPLYPEIKTRKDDTYTSLLDVGCGVGITVRQLTFADMKPENVKGIDIAKIFIELGFRIYKDEDSMKNNFIVGDALSLHDYFLPESFDYLYSSFLIDSLENRENVKKHLENAEWALRQGGTFFGRTLLGNINRTNISSDEMEEYLHEAGFNEIFLEKRHRNERTILYFHCYKL